MSYLEQTSAIEIKETRISFSESGKGEPLLLLHGNPGSRKDFSAMAELIAGDSIKCVFPDRPGHMGSEEIIYDTPDCWLEAEYYAEFIDRQCKGKVWLAGYSMGSFIASKIALKYPDKVKGLIFIAPYLTPDNPKEDPSSIPNLAKGAILGTFFGVVLPLLSQNKMTSHLQKVFAPQALPDEYLETWLPRYTRFETLMAMMADKNSMLDILGQVHEQMSGLKCQVTAIVGKEDKVCSPLNQINLIKEKLPKAEIHEIEGAGHGLPLTHAGICAEIIKKLMR
ncbi:MAG: alpha/beta hydrolase [Candidatus Riflebacteria bacterium]